MIVVKNKAAIRKMEVAGACLSKLFDQLSTIIKPGISTLEIDSFVDAYLLKNGLVSRCKGYKGYQHVSCISVNDVIVHGVPLRTCALQSGDIVTVDICASYKGYCADMARCFFVGATVTPESHSLVKAAEDALHAGIQQAKAGNRVGDISYAIEQVVSGRGYGIVRDFAGHGIGKAMHEEPEVLNYGKPGTGPTLRPGMTLAIEPMITSGDHRVKIDHDGWTARTADGSFAAHIEDTVLITTGEPRVLTRTNGGK